jgi:hypothetical protein
MRKSNLLDSEQYRGSLQRRIGWNVPEDASYGLRLGYPSREALENGKYDKVEIRVNVMDRENPNRSAIGWPRYFDITGHDDLIVSDFGDGAFSPAESDEDGRYYQEVRA